MNLSQQDRRDLTILAVVSLLVIGMALGMILDRMKP